MKKITKLLILKLIKNDGNISLVLKQGYEYNQILGFIKELIEEKYFVLHGKKLQITNKGLKEIETLNSEFQRKGIERWIEPESNSKISKLSKNDIFLPKQNELFFE